MNNQEYIESGLLELYVFGLLDETQTAEIAQLSQKEPDIKAEIIDIEKAIINFSESMSPFLSNKNYGKIREALLEKHGVVEMKPKTNIFTFIGWAAAVLLLIGVGYQFTQLQNKDEQIANIQSEKSKLNEALVETTLKNEAGQTALAVIRDTTNTVVTLAGQEVSPTSQAKVYWNKQNQAVYVDASGLPEPPKGMEYQVWSLKLDPLTPTSIGLLSDFDKNNSRVFKVENATDAQAFGITLEPAGGSATPTLEQLYTLGKA